jgi:hypothetical protein
MISSTMMIAPSVEGKRPRPHADGDCETAVAEFIRTKGVTRCPTACVLPTQGSVAAADRAALAAYAAVRDQVRRARAAARARAFSTAEPIPSDQ